MTLEYNNIDLSKEFLAYKNEQEEIELDDYINQDFAEDNIDAQEPQKQKKEEEIKTEEKSTSASVAADIGLGVAQSPRAVAYGLRQAAQELLDTTNDIANSFNKNVFDLGAVEINKDGINYVRKGSYESPQLPKIDAPKTTTGNIIASISQFLGGYGVVGKALKQWGILQGTGKAVNLSRSAIQGTLGDLAAFDEQEGRLSNMIEDVPALRNPITEFLSAKDDGVALGKFKQALEGLGLGVAVEGVIKGVSVIKKARAVKKQVQESIPIEEQVINGKDFADIGDPENPELIIKKQLDGKLSAAEKQTSTQTPKKIIKGSAREPSASDAIEINFARINSEEDIKNLMQSIANDRDLIKSVTSTRRGVRSNLTTLKAAEEIDGFDTLLSRRVGESLNAEQATAARMVYVATSNKLYDTAVKAAAPTATKIDQFNFRKMVALHHAIQKEMLGARAEAGRALQAWRIEVGQGQNAKAIDDILGQFGGVETSEALAKRIAAHRNMNTTELNTITQKASGASSVDAIADVWTLGLLTNPETHTVNYTSNLLTAIGLAAERATASALSKGNEVPLEEVLYFASGLITEQKQAWKNFAKTLKTGESSFSQNIGKFEVNPRRSLDKSNLEAGGVATPIAYTFDFLGRYLNKVGDLLTASDDYSKTLLYKAQLQAQAAKEGVSQGYKGQELKQFIARTVEDPSVPIKERALEFAKYGTYQKDLGFVGANLHRMVRQYPSARFIAPFIRTPINIFKFAYERTPLAFLSKNVRDEISAGGVRRQMAMAKIGFGSSVMSLGVDMALNGRITGSGSPDSRIQKQLRDSGWQPYSIKINDKYYSYARFEPLSTILGVAADYAEILSNYDAYDIEAQSGVEEVGTAVMIAISNQLTNKTFLSGFSNLIEMLSDPKRYGDSYARGLARSVVPAGVAAFERKVVSPEIEYVTNITDALKARTPGLSSSVPKVHNIWGEPVSYQVPTEEGLLNTYTGRVLNMFNPVQVSVSKDTPIDNFLRENGFFIDLPERTQSFDGVGVDLTNYPEIYQRLVVLRGQESKLPQYMNYNMKDYLNKLVQNKVPQSLMFLGSYFEKEDQSNYISKVVSDYNKAAKDRLKYEYPIINQLIKEEIENKKVIELNPVDKPLP